MKITPKIDIKLNFSWYISIYYALSNYSILTTITLQNMPIRKKLA